MVEHALLDIQIGGWGPDGSLLEGFVEPFVGPGFLRTARRDALMGDAELERPDVEAVEVVDAGGGEGRAVVGADGLGEAAGAEQVAEVRLDAGAPDIGQALGAEEIAAEVIDHCEG
ncbi:MAG TPA: hypothetical protein VNJ09_02420 [Chthonomonadales bacterium]|nr:hypothetical protein [Chthonomonadales bacterium]